MKTLPDKNGHFDIFGGRYAAETLMPALLELEEAYGKANQDKSLPKNLTGISANTREDPHRFTSPKE